VAASIPNGKLSTLMLKKFRRKGKIFFVYKKNIWMDEWRKGMEEGQMAKNTAN